MDHSPVPESTHRFLRRAFFLSKDQPSVSVENIPWCLHLIASGGGGSTTTVGEGAMMGRDSNPALFDSLNFGSNVFLRTLNAEF